jgi:hypothetical protein
VSDWVQHIAGDTLRERALIVVEIESSSAIDLSVGDIGRAIAAADEGVSSRKIPLLAKGGGGLKTTLAMTGAPALPSGPDSSDLEKTIDDRASRPVSSGRAVALPPPGWDTLPLVPPGASPARMPLPKTLPSVTPSDRRASVEPPAPSSGDRAPTSEDPRVTSTPAPRPPQPSVVTASEVRARPRRRRGRLIATAVGSALVFLVVLGLFAFATLSGTTKAEVRAAPPPSATASAPARAGASGTGEPGPAPLPPTTASAAPTPAPSTTETPSPASAAPADVPAPTREPHKRTGGRSSATPPPPAASSAPVPDCNPAFTYDKDGLKHYKEECL